MFVASAASLTLSNEAVEGHEHLLVVIRRVKGGAQKPAEPLAGRKCGARDGGLEDDLGVPICGGEWSTGRARTGARHLRRAANASRTRGWARCRAWGGQHKSRGGWASCGAHVRVACTHPDVHFARR